MEVIQPINLFSVCKQMLRLILYHRINFFRLSGRYHIIFYLPLLHISLIWQIIHEKTNCGADPM